MTVLLLMLCVVMLGALVIVTGMAPHRSQFSAFERQRRLDTQTKSAALDARRQQLLPDVLSLQRVMAALLLVAAVVLLVALLGWLLGVLTALLAALTYGAVARLRPLQRRSQNLYNRYELAVLTFVERARPFLRIVQTASSEPLADIRIASREELQHRIEQLRGSITPEEKTLLLASLQFGQRQVREVMAPADMIDSVNKTELLGPLVLDDLHKTGHSRFPVIDGDINRVVGMLYVPDLLSLGSKQSVTAGKAMEPRVFYIRQDQTLSHALAAFLRTQHLLFIVVNELRETVGLLSLEDTLEALIGRKIVDEFDAHDDLRVVARRNPHGNNRTSKGEDV